MNKSSFLKEVNYNTKQDRILWEPYSYRLKIFDNRNTYYLLFRNKDKKISEFIEPENLKFKELSNYEDSLPNEVIDFGDAPTTMLKAKNVSEIFKHYLI